MRITEAVQVVGKMTPTIWNLPCVTSAYKTMLGATYLRVETRYDSAVARPRDWICRFEDGHWDVLTDDEYQLKLEKQ